MSSGSSLASEKEASLNYMRPPHTPSHVFNGNEILIKCVSFSKLMGEKKEVSFVYKGKRCSETAERKAVREGIGQK